MKNKIIEAYKAYISEKYNSRNQISANIMHNAIRTEVLPLVKNDGYIVKTSTYGGEYKLESEFHDKKLDVTILDPKTNNVIIAISFKMPLSSVNKNLKNYFEMNIGDAALTRDAGIPFIYIMITDKSPWKKHNKTISIEEISQTSIQPFSKIMRAKSSNKYRPSGMFIVKCDFNDLEYKKSLQNSPLSQWKSDKDAHLAFLEKNLSVDNLKLGILQSDNSWDDNFDKLWESLLKLIKYEIEIYKIRLNNF